MMRDTAYEEAEQRIERAQQEHAVELDLGGLGLSEVPELPGGLAELHELKLSANRLSSLPDWVGRLTQLRALDASGNQIISLPESLGRLEQLQVLDVSWNELASLPETLGRLRQLQALRVSWNELTALPESLGSLSQLQRLDISRSRLTALPPWLSQLPCLQTLVVSSNELSSLPEWLAQLTHLQTLIASSNQVIALPEGLAALRELQTLVVAINELKTLPEWLGQLTQLQTLDVAWNHLASLPESLGRLPQLQTLNVARNELSSLPDWLGQLKELRTLDVSGNQSTSLPESLGGLTFLQNLDVSRNQLASLPEWMVQLTELQTLKVSGNRLTSLPEWLPGLTRLQDLDVSRNQLTLLPEWLDQLSQLQVLDVSWNRLGFLPECLGRLTGLQRLIADNNQLAALPEGMSQLTQLQVLFIGSNPLASLPEWLGQLRCLRALMIAWTQLTSLPEWLRELTEIESLNVSGNQLTSLPEWLGRLTRLCVLNVCLNRLDSLPDCLGELQSLGTLYVHGNRLTDLPDAVGKLTKLDRLWLGSEEEGNPLEQLPPTLRNCTRLRILGASSCRLKSVPDWLGELTELRMLDLSRNLLTDLPVSLGQLHWLSSLDLQSNQLSRLPANLGELASVKSLYLDGNLLQEFPAWLTRLTRLESLGLARNQLTMVPEGITQLVYITDLRLEDNPLKQPPPEVATGEGNVGKIRNFYEELRAQGEARIYEAKLVLVGEPGSGKTSLAKKLLDPRYVLNPDEAMTKGIDVERWPFPYSPDVTFQCHIWDFGTQEITHATHRFFLTKRSLYVLLADNRKEDIDFYYWLSMLELLTGRSPVLIVLNERYGYKKYVPQSILRRFESLIQNVFPVNLKDNTGLADLSRAIQEQLRKLPHVGKEPFPRKWLLIRRRLEAESRDYITYDEFLQVCQDNKIGEEKAGYIGDLLHDLGVILYFRDDLLLRNLVILNTRWATEAVYAILFDHAIVEKGGEFDEGDLPRVWPQPCYRNKYAELLQLMVRFKLCYKIEDSQTYIVPTLLHERLTEEGDLGEYARDKPILHFQYLYDFMPKGIISQLIVGLHKYIYEKQRWKNAVVVQYLDSRAEIVEDRPDNIIKIRIVGPDRLRALDVIRNQMVDVHDPFKNLIVHEMVPCNCDVCRKSPAPHFFAYEELKQYREEGEQYIKCRAGKIKNVNVLSLISDVIIREGERMIGEGQERMRVVVQNKFMPTVEAKAGAKASSRSESQIRIDLRDNLPTIQSALAELKSAIPERSTRLKEDLAELSDNWDEVCAGDDKERLKRPMARLQRFLMNIGDEKSDFNKVIRGVQRGMEMAQKVGRAYNKLSQWVGLPHVPDLFLGDPK